MKPQKHLASSIALLLLTVCMVIGLSACNMMSMFCQHQWTAATCTSPKTCALCQKTEGDPLGHTGGTATCSQKAVCTVCNNEYGDLAAHAFTENVVKSEALKSAANCTSAAVYYKSCSCGAVSTNAADTFIDGRIGKHQYGQSTVCSICGFDAGDLYYYNLAESFFTTDCGSIKIKDFVYEIETNDTEPSGVQKATSVDFVELELFYKDGEIGGNGHCKISTTYFGNILTKHYEAYATISDGYVYLFAKDEGSHDAYVRYSLDEVISQYMGNMMFGDEEKNNEVFSFIDDTILPTLEILAKNSKSDINKLLDSTLNAVFTFEKQADGSVLANLNKDKLLVLNNTLAEKNVAEVIDIYYGEGTFDGLVDFVYEILDLKVSKIPEFVEENGLDYDDFVAKLQAFSHKLGNPEKGEEGYIDFDEQIKNSEYSDSILADLFIPSLPEGYDSYKKAIDDYIISELRSNSLYALYDYSEETRTQINDGIEEIFKYFNISLTTNAAGEFTNIHLDVNKFPYGGRSDSNGVQAISYDYYVSFSLDVIANGTINVTWGNIVDEFNKEMAPVPDSEKEELEFNINIYDYFGSTIYFQDTSYYCDKSYNANITQADLSAPFVEQFMTNCGDWNSYTVNFNTQHYYGYVYFAQDYENVFFIQHYGNTVKLTKTAKGFTVTYEDGETKELTVAISGTPTAEQLAKLIPEIFEGDYFYAYDSTEYTSYYYNIKTKEYSYEDQHNWTYSYVMLGEECNDGYVCTRTCSKCNAKVQDYGSYHDYDETRIECSDHGMCGGYIEKDTCRACGYSYIYTDYYECNWSYVQTDSNEYYVYVCSDCNAIRKTKTIYGETNANCEYTVTNFYIYIANGKEIFNDSDSYTNTSHTYEYSYKLIGDDCGEGYQVIQTCKVCNYTYSYTSSGHYTNWNDIYFSDFGMCGGYVREERCQICDTVGYMSVSDYYCSWEDQGTDNNGYSVVKCSSCNAIRKTKTTTTEKDKNCNQEEVSEYIYLVNGTEIYRGSKSYYYDRHNYVTSYEMFGETCDDGYEATRTCTDCSYSYSYTSRGHDTSWNNIYFGNFGMCGGYVYEERCQICDTVDYMSVSDYYCNWERLYDDSNGYSIYKCNDCNAIKKEKSSTTTNENGWYTTLQEYIYIVNGVEVYRGSYTY